MPTARAGLGAATAVLALSACGTAPTAGPPPTTSTSYATPSPSEQADERLSPANLASELLGKLAAKGTFRVVTRTTVAGQDPTVVIADVRLTGEAGLIATGGGRKVIKTGKALYLKDADFTGSRSRSWFELADGGHGAAARSADRLVRAAQVYAVIGAAAHATTFQRADRITVNGVPAWLPPSPGSARSSPSPPHPPNDWPPARPTDLS